MKRLRRGSSSTFLLLHQLHHTLYCISHSRFILCSVSSAFPLQPSVLLLSSLSAPPFLVTCQGRPITTLLLTQPARGTLSGESTQQFHSTLACLLVRVTAGATPPSTTPHGPPIQQFKNSKASVFHCLRRTSRDFSLLGRDVATADEFAISMGILLGSLAAS